MWSWLFAPKLTPARRWVLAAGGCTAAANNVVFDRLAIPNHKPQAQRNGLRVGWNVKSPDDARRTLRWLQESGHNAPFQEKCAQIRALGSAGIERACARMPADEQRLIRFLASNMKKAKGGHILAFDLDRVVWMGRLAVSAGYFRPAEAWAVIIPAGLRLQETYTSWEEYATQYTLGSWFLSGGQQPASRGKSIPHLLKDPACPWSTLDWGMDLSELHGG